MLKKNFLPRRMPAYATVLETYKTSGEASPTIWSCYANFKSSLFISLEIDCFHGL
jgi:hypothetical protein